MKLARNVVRVVTGVTVFCILSSVVILLRHSSYDKLRFQFNWYMLAYIVGIVLIAILLVFLSQRKNRSHVTFWFTCYFATILLIMVGGLLSGMSLDTATYAAVYPLTSLAGVLSIFSFFLFALTYTGYEEYIYRPFTWLGVLGSAMVLFYTDASTTLFVNPAATLRTSTGYPLFPEQAHYHGIYEAWIVVLLISPAILLLSHYRKVRFNARKRRQTLLLVIGTVAPIAVGLTTLQFLPALGINLPLTGALTFLIQAAVAGYAILRYRVFDVEPAALSDTVLATMNESVVTINSYQEVEHINPNAARLLGVSAESVIGKTLDKVFDTDTALLISEKIGDGNTDATELDLSTPAGSTPISMLASGIRDKAGLVAGHILVFRDITKERAAKAEIEEEVVERTHEVHEEQAKLRASIEGLVLGFVLIDQSDKIVIQNNALQTILGASKPFTSMKELGESLSGFDLAGARKTIQEYGRPIEAKDINLGSKILHLQLGPVKVTEKGQTSVIGTVILVEDVTEAKVMARSKDEFFSIASHELRTPLTAILGNSSMIIDYHADILKDPEMKEMIYDIHGASERLIGIVGDFMDVSGLEQGKVVFKTEEFTLDTVLETVVYEMRTILEQKNLSLKVEPKTLGTLPAIWADKGRTKQILYNLVSNALKYTEKGGANIKLTVEGEAMKVEISDTGRGISVDNQKLLFHKLQQAGDSLLTRDTTRGTGLGLYICKILVERMGGTIALEKSAEGKGSTFSFTLPLATAARKQPSTASEAVHTDTTSGLSE